MIQQTEPAIERMAYVGLTTADAAGLCDFFERALGFRLLAAGRRSVEELTGISGAGGGAYRVTLGLGGEVIELLQFERPGRPFPNAASAADLRFQHFAIVVSDMEQAYQRLCAIGRWSAISRDGPERLPASSGGITAFKFRDPDGHPLELLSFPDGQLAPHWQARSNNHLSLGIDHSAIAVSDSARSIAFYEALGMRVAHSRNSGFEQGRAEGVGKPDLSVTAMQPRQSTPHLRLLQYRSRSNDQAVVVNDNDVAATRLAFEAAPSSCGGPAEKQTLTDPDGHRLLILTSSEKKSSVTAAAAANPRAAPISAKSDPAR